ncbi:MAG: hypothetical protein IJ209_02485 [Bacteroidaceae bacterium]|nr:hypothetical protein [Bacteroidaceae bacterium]
MNKVRLLRHFLTPALLIIFLFGCTGGRQYRALLEQADSLMAGHPDSAYALLTSVDSVGLHSQRKNVRMRYELLRAEAQNKLCIPFRTDSVLRDVVRYYDSPWRKFINSVYQIFIPPPYGVGGGGEALKARYLLGCTYRDLHEAPVALLTWEDAIAAADTTSADCDFATLFRVYGQMAEIYFRQSMPEEGLKARNNYSKYALLAGDTLNYIRGLLSRNDALLYLRDTSAVLENIKLVRNLYLDRGLTQEAARVYPSAIHIALDRGEHERADSMMQIFENESGLFDPLGNIAPSHEIYYYRKGIYYLGVHKLDSAEQQFRRLLNHEPNLVDAYRGLLILYEQRNDADSIFKYARKYEKAIGRYIEDTHTFAITQVKGLYDYNRQQRIAQKQRAKARRKGLLMMGLTLITFTSFASILFYNRKKRRADRLALLSAQNSYIEAKKNLDRLQKDISYLREKLPSQKETVDLLNEKESLRQHMLSQIQSFWEEIGLEGSYNNDETELMNTEIVQLFKQIANPHTVRENAKIWQESSRPFTDGEWEGLVKEIQKYHHNLYYFITVKHKLPKRQFKVCILSRLFFSNQEMAVLMNTSFSNISNLRSKIANALFAIKDLSLLDEMLRYI